MVELVAIGLGWNRFFLCSLLLQLLFNLVRSCPRPFQFSLALVPAIYFFAPPPFFALAPSIGPFSLALAPSFGPSSHALARHCSPFAGSSSLFYALVARSRPLFYAFVVCARSLLCAFLACAQHFPYFIFFCGRICYSFSPALSHFVRWLALALFSRCHSLALAPLSPCRWFSRTILPFSFRSLSLSLSSRALPPVARVFLRSRARGSRRCHTDWVGLYRIG